VHPDHRQAIRVARAFAAYGAVAALVWLPVALERSVETTSFEDRIGSVPVEISLTHNGSSTLDTGALGRLYWEQTGALGFGARVRVTDTPQAGGTLASYASPRFVRANAAFVSEPDEVANAYGAELRSQLVRGVLLRELVAFLLGGLVLTAVFRARSPLPAGWPRRRAVNIGVAASAAAAVASCGLATWLFERWEGSTEIHGAYAMPGVPELSFSSPQTLEIARQIRPFLEKNNERIQERSRAYLENAETTLRAELSAHAGDLAPREDELIVLAEADPQGSHVGTELRVGLYDQLVAVLEAESFAMRTISGDLTSNGTVAEAGFVANEVAASGEIPTVIVKGDHDTDITLEQLDETDAANPDLDLTEIAGLDVVAGNDPAFKTLFGGLVVNESGVTESELGERVRAYVDDEGPEAVLVLFHQPRSAAGYLDLETLDVIAPSSGDVVPDLTRPIDDGIPDVPPGIINIGHLHDAAPPRVIWNTDGEDITWTVVNQLGTSGGVEERPTYNRFSTPYSTPLKTLSIQLQYVDTDTGLQTGYASIDFSTDGTATITDRADIGLR
jgi:hypothetical protein